MIDKDNYLIEILNFFTEKFCQFDCLIETNYKELPVVKISFEANQLPHLLGFQKINQVGGIRGVENIKNKKITLKAIEKHDKYFEIKPRIMSFKRLNDMFQPQGMEYCLLKKDNKNATKLNQVLDIILFDKEKRNNHIYILGLSKANNYDIYYPRTFFETKASKYSHLKMTRIKNITWV